MTPDIRIVSGSPTDEELAIVTALLKSIGGVKELPEPTKLSKWGDPASHMRRPIPVGDGAWRQSAWASR